MTEFCDCSAQRPDELVDALYEIWERSVRATHDFLTEADIEAIAAYVPDALRSVECLQVAYREGKPVGFMGTENGNLEMLFLDPNCRGLGIGKQFVSRAIAAGTKTVDVNE